MEEQRKLLIAMQRHARCDELREAQQLFKDALDDEIVRDFVGAYLVCCLGGSIPDLDRWEPDNSASITHPTPTEELTHGIEKAQLRILAIHEISQMLIGNDETNNDAALEGLAALAILANNYLHEALAANGSGPGMGQIKLS